MALAPIPQPKILSVITIPTGGWTIKFTYTSLGGGVQFDTSVTATMAAGDYFMAWDGQSDDFIQELSSKLNTAITTSVGGAGGEVTIWIDSNHKVNFGFSGNNYQGNPYRDVKIEWTQNDGASIGAVLGFDTTADDSATGVDNPSIVGDWHHAYGWYADDDGILAEDDAENTDTPNNLQSIAPSGHSKVQYIGSVARKILELKWLPQGKTWSQDVSYEAAPVKPYERNEPLECWWKEARQGKRFRFYRDGQINTLRSVDRGNPTAGTTTTMTDSGKSWDLEPFEFKDRLLYIDNWTDNEVGNPVAYAPARFHIASHTATVITVTNANPDGQSFKAAQNYYMMEQTYDTYVLEMQRNREFRPREFPKLNKYEFSIRAIKYQA